MKKAPPPATNSSQSPVSKSQMQQMLEPRYSYVYVRETDVVLSQTLNSFRSPDSLILLKLFPVQIYIPLLCFSPHSSLSPPVVRYVSSSQRGSQTAALSRLAQIESRIRSHKQARPGPKPAENLTSDVGISPPPPTQSLGASVQLSAQSSSDQSLKGKHFLKNKTAVAVNNSNTAAASSPKGPDVGVRSRSRAADAVVPWAGLETKSVRVVSGVSLESDEEDMRKLLGDSLDSTDNSFLLTGRPSSVRTTDKVPLN